MLDMDNPYTTPMRQEQAGHPSATRSPVLRIAAFVALLTGIVAIGSAAWILAMISRAMIANPQSDRSFDGLLTSFVVLVVGVLWILAPYLASAGLAFVFRKSLPASLILLVGCSGICIFGSYVYYGHWYRLLVPPDPMAPKTMWCGPPLEAFFPIFQWLGVAGAATIAGAVWIIAKFVGRWMDWRRRNSRVQARHAAVAFSRPFADT